MFTPSIANWKYWRSFLDNLQELLWYYPITILQRGFRGYSDRDIWSMDSYLADVIPDMLFRLKENLHGYPGYDEASTPEKWDALLDEMAEGFKAAKRVIEDDYFMETNSDILTRKPTDEEIRKWQQASQADQKLFEEKAKLFIKWYFALWD